MIDEAVHKASAAPSDPVAVARLGMVLHAHDQFAAAVTCYRRASRLDSGRFIYPYYEGAALAAEGKYSEAVEPLSRASALDSGSVPIRLRLAEALFESGQPDRARHEYEIVIRLDASVAAAHYGLGRTCQGEAAISGYRKALDLFPRYGAAQFALAAEYRKTGRSSDAARIIQGYEKNRTVTPPIDDPFLAEVVSLNSGSTGLIRRAQALEREGRLAEAARVCEQVTEQDPAFAEAWVNLVSLYGRLNEAAKIEHAYSAAVAAAPDRAEIYYNYGVFCLSANRVKDAGEAFRKATELDPRNPDAWNNLATVTERFGDLDRAASYYRRATLLRPDARVSHFGLGRIYAQQRRLPDAILELEKTTQPEDDNTPGYLYALGAVHARAGHISEAKALLSQARHSALVRGQQQLVSAIDRDLRSIGAAR